MVRATGNPGTKDPNIGTPGTPPPTEPRRPPKSAGNQKPGTREPGRLLQSARNFRQILQHPLGP
eukprot:2717234-Pyramimonas_sp.AAC.1